MSYLFYLLVSFPFSYLYKHFIISSTEPGPVVTTINIKPSFSAILTFFWIVSLTLTTTRLSSIESQPKKVVVLVVVVVVVVVVVAFGCC